MFNKFVLLFFIFGCWLKYLDYPADMIFYNIWAVMVIGWSVLNAIAAFAYITKKAPPLEVSEHTQTLWFLHNFMATLSFWLCGETYLTLAFLGTSVLFMFVVFFTRADPKKKKRK